MILSSNYYTGLFGTDVPAMESLIATALRHGGDYADLFFESTTSKDLLLRDGEVTSGGFHVDYGVGIRVLKGDKTGYAYSESTRPADMVSAAKAASAIAQGAPETEPYRTHAFAGKPNPAADRYPVRDDWRLCQTEPKYSMGLKMCSPAVVMMLTMRGGVERFFIIRRRNVVGTSRKQRQETQKE